MNKPPVVLAELITRVPLRIDPHFGETQLANATGFFFRGANGTSLVTNWHVVSGRHPETLACLDKKTAALPDRLRISVPVNKGIAPAIVVGWNEYWVSLYDDESREKAVWRVHPDHGHNVDVVAIPLGGLEKSLLIAANDPTLMLEDLRLYPSLDVYVVGFPLGMFGGARFPIWKRGSIASEPDLNVAGKPCFYIDTATREGMSGAPVYAQEVGLWQPNGVTDLASSVIGKGRSFVGVYASRVGAEDEFKAQLGLVWKTAALECVVNNGVPGESSYVIHGET
jgi:trypsin-like peptidase